MTTPYDSDLTFAVHQTHDPHTWGHATQWRKPHAEQGMSLRDYFAINGILDGEPEGIESDPYSPFVQPESRHHEDRGITLRDHLAANAMAGRLSCDCTVHKPHQFAKWCYELADAMLNARQAA